MTTPDRTHPAELPPLLVVPWDDPEVDALGLDPRGTYAETYWLPLLGPTATWLLRRLADELDDQPRGFSADAETMARCLGIGTRGGSSGPFPRSIERLVRFGLAHHQDHGILAVRRNLPVLGRSQANRLPRALRGEHDAWLRERDVLDVRRPVSDAHAARLARSLLDVGATAEEVVVQLGRWRFTDAVARRALAIAGGGRVQAAGLR